MRRTIAHTLGRGAPIALVVAVTLIAGGSWAIASGGGGVIHACAARHGGALRLARHCHANERSVSWNIVGPPGTPGSNGAAGTAGPQGLQGPGAKGFNFWDIAPAGGGTGAPDTVLRIGPLTFVDQCRNGTSGGVDMDLSMVDSAGEDGVDGTLTTEDATAPSPATTRFEDLGVSAGDPLYLVSTDTGNGYTQTDDDDFAISYQVLDHGTGQMFQVTVTAEANGTGGADYCNAYGVVTPTS